jgi:hypothetical protein
MRIIIVIIIAISLTSCAATQKWGGNPGIGGHCAQQGRPSSMNYDF